jgi:hypothetical protein
LTFGTHASEMIREFDGISMSNDLTVDYVGWAWVYNTTDSASQSKYWVLERWIVDGSIKDATTAQERADVEIANRKNPKEKTQVVVNSSYDLESIQIWDTIQILNKVWESTSSFKAVHKIEYREEIAVLHLDDYDSIEKSLLSLP